MIDVSEKFGMVDMLDTANDIKDLCDEMETMKVGERESRLSKSTLSLEQELDEERPRPRSSVSECLSKSIADPRTTASKKRTFKTISEHVIVITKTFTARK